MQKGTVTREDKYCRCVVFTFSCLATSLADEPETSIHVFEKRAHAESIKTT
jgi:hypothetical protein